MKAGATTTARSLRTMPNVLVIMVDQLRADILRAYGGLICETPAIDQFMRQSRVFDRAYTPLSVCAPARASLLTGQYPHNHGVLSNDGQLLPGVLRDSPQLLSRQLERLGYDRWYIGKWHLGGGDNLPFDCGLPGQQFAGHGEGGYDYPEYLSYLAKLDLQLKLADGPRSFGWHSYGDLAGGDQADVSAFLTDAAIRFLDGWSERGRVDPFFVWVNYWGPHEPYLPSDERLRQYDGVNIPPWPNFPDESPLRPRVHDLKIPPESRGAGWQFWEDAVRHYFGSMSLIDGQIGRLLDWIESSGNASDTIVIFAADHGESLGAHGCQDKGHFMYEETYKIPLAIRCPGYPPGRDDNLVSLVDLYPTIMELVAGEDYINDSCDGRSLIDLLRGGAIRGGGVPWRQALVAEFHGLVTPFTQRMIVERRYKYIWNMGDLDELYDLESDPHEVANLIRDPNSVSVLERLQDQLLEWMYTTNDEVRGYFERHMQNGRLSRTASQTRLTDAARMASNEPDADVLSS